MPNVDEFLSYRSTPFEVLHTILLGLYKYLLRALMSRMSTAQKEEIQARVTTCNFSGLVTKLGYNLCRHYRSFVGRDFKALAQVGLFILGPYMLPEEKTVWLALSKVCWSMLHLFMITHESRLCFFTTDFQDCILQTIFTKQHARMPCHLQRVCCRRERALSSVPEEGQGTLVASSP